MAFCEWLNKKINSRVPKGFVVRLPTEAEWEKAGRGTDKRIYPWGNDVPDTRLCNFSDNKIKGTTPVGHYSPQGDSPYGCVDMIGNVWEWTHSQRSSYPYRRYDGREDENKNNHVIRGGSFRCELRSLACNLGFTQEYDGREIDQGFRISIAPLLNGIEEMELAHREQEAEKQVKQERIKKAEQARRQTEDKARSEGNLMSLLLSENVPMVFVRVPAGKFLIGRNNSEEKNLSTNSQISQNEVYLDEYWIGKYPVTNAQWRVYVQSVKEKVTIPWENGMIPDGMENDPVWLYSNYDVVGFCDWVSKKTGKKIRLPSETEWEKAARGTDGRIYPWGNDVPNEQYLNFQQNIGTTTPVGLFSPLGDSPYGCADMAGNLRQIVNDWNSEDYYGVTPKLSPTGPSRGDQWVVRGSIFWENDPQITRRFSFDPECGYFSFGFRCAYSIPISVIQLEEDVFMEFVKISGGKFLMGSKEPDNMAGKEEKPQHQVYLDEYWMGRYEVTNRQWEVFVRLNKKKAPVHWINGTIPKGKENHPVVNVSWYDVVAFCDWISEKTGKKISLPSEAEWEMAARGTDGRIYPWGNDHLNLWNGYQTDLESISVGQFSPDSDSPYGCSDMVGNIWEWTGDWYGQYTEAAVENPTGPINGKVRVLRGGSWGDCGVNGLRVTLREGGSPEVGHKKIGFRCKMPEVNPSSNRKKKQEKTENYFSILLSEDVLIEFVRVPSGKFFMGRKRVRSEFYETNEDSSPQHEVFLDEYWMGKFPVTNAQYRIFVEETNHSQPEEGIPGGKDDHPVVGISWNDATAFCEWISKKTGRKIRLPTEAEWEKAARGTDGRIRPWGEDTPEEWRKRYFARSYFSNKQRSLPVGRYSPEADSPYGCADMAGWLREWVFDWYDENYYSYSPNRNPSGPMRGKEKSQRGGGWFDDIDNKSSFIMNVADRFSCDPASPNERTGFRCVATSETLK